MVLVTGTVVILVSVLLGSQFMVEGKVYNERVAFLRKKGYEVNTTVSWSDYEEWIDWVNRRYFKGRMNSDVREVEDWMEWYGLLKEAEKAMVYDDSIFEDIHACDENHCLWFITVNSRGTDHVGHIQTYVIFPE